MEVKETYEVEDLTVPVSPEVKGSLRSHVEFWHSIGSPNFILSVIYEGYRLAFEQVPPGNFPKNNKSAFDHSQFVEQVILELLHTRRVVEVQALPTPFVIIPLSVSIQRNGKKKLILDLRYVNKFLVKRRIEYEDWEIALSYFQEGAYMFSFDLKSGYHHIDIPPGPADVFRVRVEIPR